MSEKKTERSLEEGRTILLLYLLCAFCAKGFTRIETLCFHLSVDRFARVMESLGVGSFHVVADPLTKKIPFVDMLLIELQSEGLITLESDAQREIIKLEGPIRTRSPKDRLEQKLNIDYRVDLMEKSLMLGPAQSTVNYYSRCIVHYGRD